MDTGRTKKVRPQTFFNRSQLENFDGHFSLNNSQKAPSFSYIFELKTAPQTRRLSSQQLEIKD